LLLELLLFFSEQPIEQTRDMLRHLRCAETPLQHMGNELPVLVGLLVPCFLAIPVTTSATAAAAAAAAVVAHTPFILQAVPTASVGQLQCRPLAMHTRSFCRY
jgi:hypothetical protein